MDTVIVYGWIKEQACTDTVGFFFSFCKTHFFIRLQCFLPKQVTLIDVADRHDAHKSVISHNIGLSLLYGAVRTAMLFDLHIQMVVYDIQTKERHKCSTSCDCIQ